MAVASMAETKFAPELGKTMTDEGTDCPTRAQQDSK
jgi:hypothetical protein